MHRRFFDPDFWRVVIFDHRGAGRSRPLGSPENNTTGDLVSDIETLRRHLGVERCQAFGDVPFYPLGVARQPTVLRQDITGVPEGFVIFWNVRRT